MRNPLIINLTHIWAVPMVKSKCCTVLTQKTWTDVHQSAAWPSPCLSVNWKAWTRRRVSSTERPTGRSFMVICLRIPLGSIMNRPLFKNRRQRAADETYGQESDDRKVNFCAWREGSHVSPVTMLLLNCGKPEFIPPVGNAFIFFQDSVVCGDCAPCVWHKGNFHAPQTALLTWCVGPSET